MMWSEVIKHEGKRCYLLCVFAFLTIVSRDCGDGGSEVEGEWEKEDRIERRFFFGVLAWRRRKR